MSFGGSVSAMITSLKNNARPRKSLFDKTDYFRNRSLKNLKNKHGKTETPQQLKKARIQIAVGNRILIIKMVLALFISGLISIFLLYLVLNIL